VIHKTETSVRSDGNGHVFIGGTKMDFQTYVVMRLEAGKEKMHSLGKRTARLEAAALGVMAVCCLAVLYAVLSLVGLPGP